MSQLDFWHPVLPAKDLPADRAVGICLAGREIALFRSGPGKVAALDDCCLHRRMRLSIGRVIGDRLQCVYHGWKFAADGQGESPGTPKMYACAKSYDAAEANDAIWVKARGSNRPLPTLEQGEFYYVGLLQHRFPVPFEIVMDGFSEVEHTGFVHDVFGVVPERNHECEVNYEVGDDFVTVRNRGPARRPNSWLVRRLMNYRPWMWFHSDFTFRFDPPQVVIDHWWAHPRQPDRQAMMRYRVHQFFVPVNDQESVMLTYTYGLARYPAPLGGGIGIVGGYVLRKSKEEIDADIWLTENLADKSTDIEGMKLSRFDRAMGLNRERLRRIYFGQAAAKLALLE